MNKHDTLLKISKHLQLPQGDILKLLQSRSIEDKTFAIKAVSDFPDSVFLPILTKLTHDKNPLVASDAIECCALIDSEKTLKIAKKQIEHTHRFVQASALFVIGRYGDRSLLSTIIKAFTQCKSSWRKIGLLEVLYYIDNNDTSYIDAIIFILYATTSYHTQCAALNTIDSIRNWKNRMYIQKKLKLWIFPEKVDTFTLPF
jgi:hypothetical protein